MPTWVGGLAVAWAVCPGCTCRGGFRSAHRCAWARPHSDVRFSSKGGTVLFLLRIMTPPASPHSVLDAERHTQDPTLGWTGHHPAPSARGPRGGKRRGPCPHLTWRRLAGSGSHRRSSTPRKSQASHDTCRLPLRSPTPGARCLPEAAGSPAARARRHILPLRSSGATEETDFPLLSPQPS